MWMLAYISEWAYDRNVSYELVQRGGAEMARRCTVLICRRGPMSRWQAPSGSVFYFHPSNCSVTAAHKDPSYLLASSILFVLSHWSSLCGPNLSLERTNTTTTTTMEKMTQSHHLSYTCNESL